MAYNFKAIERKWQKVWETKKIYRTKDKVQGKRNFYHLVMFPYPSGNLHLGHWFIYAPADVYARFKRMAGYNIMSPIGFDAFGLPAENAALKHGIHPEKWTMRNIKTMTVQLMTMGNSYDWSRKVITCLPDYYKWNQLFFLWLYRKGLAYRKKAPANWCPQDKTVLANEQVVDGRCERCGSMVIQKEIDQWLFKITDYAEQLLDGLNELDWPERTKTMQRNWIGRSEGVLLKFQVQGLDLCIEVFTTRADTVLGATYLVLAPEHELITKLKARIKNWLPVQKYIRAACEKTEQERIAEGREKTGIELTGLIAINPANKKEIPVWISDYVVSGYGTGAIMAVPQHDERDRAFAEKFKLPIVDEPLVPVEEIAEKLHTKNIVKYKLRDWLISRQRYWGTPIPVVHCKQCGIVPVPEKDLPVKLPPLKDFKPADDGRSPLARNKKFLSVKCPSCRGKGERDTDTMDTFVDSSWYFLRYASPKSKKEAFNKEAVSAWLPVNMYIGGAEHTVLHLLYSRFFTKFLHDEGLLAFTEPFSALRHQGIILGSDGQKMSKSKGNVADPDDLVKEFGADTVRMHLCFMSDYAQGGPWNPKGILGVARFLDRALRLKTKIKAQKQRPAKKVHYGEAMPEDDETLLRALHKAIKKVSEDIEVLKFNTAISALMIFLNDAEKEKKISAEAYGTFLKLLAPFAPHLAEELWRGLGNKKSIHFEEWPKYNARYTKEDTIEIVVQVNGKVRDTLTVSAETTRDEIEALAAQSELVQKYLDGKKPERVIYVPQKLVNIVYKPEE